ncbi:MAG: phosphopantothenoylcysteine decarboxylase, partial [Desulfurococcales archaeon]|nr:phosphopantothenoylcysteine decarboxylase [Desulfurococcales archaeon]
GYTRAVEILRSQAVIIPPRVEEGIAKYPDPWIVARVAAATTSRGEDLKGKRVLVTAGATREWIDPTRFISNPSSGRMGIELAIEAWARGAEVDLVYGHVEHTLPHMVNLFPAETTEDMTETVSRLVGEKQYDIALAAAAPADYRPVNTSRSKIRSGLENLSLTLTPTPKVAGILRSASKYLVVFAAETARSLGELEDYALEKMEKYRADAVIANRVGTRDVGFSSPYLDALVIWRDRDTTRKSFLGKIDKELLARLILDLSVKNMEAVDNDEESDVKRNS